MRKNIPLMMPDTIYQIFNRGIDSEALFKFKNNYSQFLQKTSKYLLPVADLYAYSLMKDHFHFCLRTLSEKEIRDNLKLNNPDTPDSLKSCSWHISNQFASLFKSHSLSINKSFSRTGGLFEEPFRRLEIDNIEDLRWLISYVHTNPRLHNVTSDFKHYQHSSYSTLISNTETILNRNLVLSTFGGQTEFEDFHQQPIPSEILTRLCLH